MSLYRQAGRSSAQRAAVAAAVALLAGLLIGFLLGRSSAGEPSAREISDRVGAELRPVNDGLSLIPGEYEQAFRGEGDELGGVRGALDRIESHVKAAEPDLEVLEPAATKTLKQRLAALRAAVERKAEPTEVERLAGQAQAALRQLPGISN